MTINGASTEMRTVVEEPAMGEGTARDAAAEEEEVAHMLNLSVVLPYMAYRKRVRYFTGEYRASNPYRMAFLVFVLLFLWSLQSFFLQRTDKEYNFGVILSLSYQMPEGEAVGGGAVALNVINYVLMVVCLVLVSAHVTTFESPFITTLGVVAMILFLVVLGRRLEYSHKHGDDPNFSSTDEATAYTLTQDVIMQAFVYLSLIHMLLSYLVRRVVPWLVRRNSVLACAGILDRRDLADAATAVSLIALPPGYSLSPERRLVACYLRYVEPWYLWWLPVVGRESITFVGEVDAAGNPSGYGEWRDTAWHGEHLTGFWHAGKPAGPFRSRETGSASSLVNLRVAYFRNRGEAIGRAACMPKLTPLQFGIVSCEVTTSGVWFKSLPRLRELLPPIDIAEGLEAEREAAQVEGRLPAAAGTAAAAAAGGTAATSAAGAGVRGSSRWARWLPWRARGKRGGASGKDVSGHGEAGDPQHCAVAMLGPELVAAAGGGAAAAAAAGEPAAAAAAGSGAHARPPWLLSQQTSEELYLDAKSSFFSPAAKHNARLRSVLATPSYAAAAAHLDALELAPGATGWGAVAFKRSSVGRSAAVDGGGAGTPKPLPRHSLRKAATSGLGEGPARAPRGRSVAVAMPASHEGPTAAGAGAGTGAAAAATAADAGGGPTCGNALAAKVPLSTTLAAIKQLQAQSVPHNNNGIYGVVEDLGHAANAVATATAAAAKGTAAVATAAAAALTLAPPATPPPPLAPMAALQAAEEALQAPTLINPGGCTTTAAADAGPAASGGGEGAAAEAAPAPDAAAGQGNAAGAGHAAAAVGSRAAAHAEYAARAGAPSAAADAAAAAGSQAARRVGGVVPPVTAHAAGWQGAAPRAHRLPRLVSMLMPLQPAPTTSVGAARRNNGRAAATTAAALIGLRTRHALASGGKAVAGLAAGALSTGHSSGAGTRQAPGDLGGADEDCVEEGDVFGEEQPADAGRPGHLASGGSRKDASHRSGVSSNRSSRGASRSSGMTRPLTVSTASAAAGFPGASDTPGSKASEGPVERRALASFIRTTKPVVPGGGSSRGALAGVGGNGEIAGGEASDGGRTSSGGAGSAEVGAQPSPAGVDDTATSTVAAASSSLPRPAAAAATLGTTAPPPPEPSQPATTPRGGSPSPGEPSLAPSDWRLANVLSPPELAGQVAVPLLPRPSLEHHAAGHLPGLGPLDPKALPPTLPTAADGAGRAGGGGSGGDLARPPEAFLFVHGLGVDLHKALRHYAQMMALLKFPPHISPMLFAWPSSVAVGYFFARYRAAERPETGLALASAVRALAADGFAGLHILVHSMGTRVLMNALPHLEAILAEEAQRAAGAAGGEHAGAAAGVTGLEGQGYADSAAAAAGGGGGGGGMKLLTVTICNPDYGLRPFVREMGFRLRAICPIVTIYGDTADGALGLSEVVNALARPVIRTRRWLRYMLGGSRNARRNRRATQMQSQVGQPRQGEQDKPGGQEDAEVEAAAATAAHGGADVSPDEVRIEMAAPAAAVQAIPAPPAAPVPPAPAPLPPPLPSPPPGGAAGGSSFWGNAAVGMPRSRTASLTHPSSPVAPAGSLRKSQLPRLRSLQRPALPTESVPAIGAVDGGGGGGDVAAATSSDESYASINSDSEDSYPHMLHGRSQRVQPDASAPRVALAPMAEAARAATAVAKTASARRGPDYDVEAAGHVGGQVNEQEHWHGDDNEEEDEEEKELAWWSERVVHYRRRLRKPLLYGWLEKSLGKRVYQIADPVTRVPLDIDVIDLSFLASNVNALRHTHFALNRELLDDLYDVVVLRRRARERMWRLEHVTGNVYSIAVCPYYISTKNL
ncbi:hypothetical protein HYH02_007619 [Chlamydomonas schloesseri]|uniref:Uncharacterized protein n=1 Tax=Chlamydomonas schloesseri TaxID=2026947 RepID=A0A835WHE5_9CHLO|nr:hypothetical protein HYH02_007619 [Chlamydomonas schloesseri]|eukprot:KAG2447289.1 hypothetical protein HYH02_007619 [Chlamydomonas schloesseri]